MKLPWGKLRGILVIRDIRDFVIAARSEPEWNRMQVFGKDPIPSKIKHPKHARASLSEAPEIVDWGYA